MSLSVTGRSELFLAQVTYIRFLSSMNQHMFLEMTAV